MNQCPHCEYSNESERGLNIHIGKVHKNKRNCKFCGEEFTYHPSSENKFCDDECYRNWRQEKSKVKTTECKVCGSDFEYHPTAERGKFCSRECLYESDYEFHVPRTKEYAEDRFKKTNCENCGKEFEYDTEGNKNGVFCSKECTYSSDKEFYTPGRSRVDRKKIECFTCGKTVERLECDIPESGRVFCDNSCRGKWVSESDIFDTPSGVFVEETGRKVKSGWEADMDRLLYSSSFDYEYESITFDIEKYHYTPDFIIEDKVIEVKGQVTERDIERANLFLEHKPEYEYIVVGSYLPSDQHIKWENMEYVLEVINE